MTRKKNPAEPALDKINIRLGKIRLLEKIKIGAPNKKDGLSEYLRRTKSAGN